MLIDFCHHSVGSTIKTDKVSFDGYEIGNLVSSNIQHKRQGFISDHFVKPPVNITLQFPCNISVYQVVIDPVIGRQQSLDLKIFTATKRISDTWLYDGNNSTVKSDGVIFNNVGFISQDNPILICVQNGHFIERRSWEKDDRQSYMNNSVTGELRSRKQGALSNVSHLNICILRTKSGSSVAIKRLEIWGIPSSTVPSHLQEKLKKHYIDAVFPPVKSDNNTPMANINEYDGSPSSDTHINKSSAACVISEEFVIPEDFIDEITCEVMACPLLLPSGKIIDQSTLDKFVNTEASWGRQPSDPFTGLEFSQGRQPLPNISLKARIDDFTFKHADRLIVAKTLGRADRLAPESVAASRLIPVPEMKQLSSSSQSYDTVSGVIPVPEMKQLSSSSQSYDTVSGVIPVPDFKKHKRTCSDSDSLINHNNTLSTIPNIDFKPVYRTNSRKRKAVDGDVQSKSTVLKYGRPSSNTVTAEMSDKRNRNRVLNPTGPASRTIAPQLNIDKNSKSCGLTQAKSDIQNEIIFSNHSTSTVKKTSSHKASLSCSLDDALKDALGGLPSFTNNMHNTNERNFHTVTQTCKKSVEMSKHDFVCNMCGIDCKMVDLIKYKLSCGHLICRTCVNNQKREAMFCNLCRSSCSSSELVRVF